VAHFSTSFFSHLVETLLYNPERSKKHAPASEARTARSVLAGLVGIHVAGLRAKRRINGRTGAYTSYHESQGGIMADTSRRGFASMDPDKQKEIASKGGRAAHAKGTAHEFTSEEARVAGRKGGVSVSRNREHMATIGRKGGESRGSNRDRSDLT
jgi:uncharacterized protein